MHDANSSVFQIGAKPLGFSVTTFDSHNKIIESKLLGYKLAPMGLNLIANDKNHGCNPFALPITPPEGPIACLGALPERRFLRVGGSLH